jgi:hypothetical protein
MSFLRLCLFALPNNKGQELRERGGSIPPADGRRLSRRLLIALVQPPFILPKLLPSQFVPAHHSLALRHSALGLQICDLPAGQSRSYGSRMMAAAWFGRHTASYGILKSGEQRTEDVGPEGRGKFTMLCSILV